MTRKTIGRSLGDRAVLKATSSKPPSTGARARFQHGDQTDLLWGLLPLKLAEWLMNPLEESPIAPAGTIEAAAWSAQDDTVRKGSPLTAHEILSLFQARKRRDAGSGAAC